MADQDTDDAALDQDPAQETEASETDVGRPGEVGYAPSDVAVTRGRMQGLGMGAGDLDAQRDPTRVESAEQFGEPGAPRSSADDDVPASDRKPSGAD